MITPRPEDHASVRRAVGARLAAAGVPSPDVDARLLVDHVVEVAGDPVGCGAALLDGLVARRIRREPLQQVIGRTWFRLLEIACAPGVFVPRPETEIVAGLAIDAAHAAAVQPAPGYGGKSRDGGWSDAAVQSAPGYGGKSRDAARPGDPAGVRIVEACTGTGAIALSIAVEVPDARIVATDVEAAAVELAAANHVRVRDGLAGAPMAPRSTLEVLRCHLLDDVDPAWRGHLDVLVANPPYLPASDRDSWEPEVADHDPQRALVGGPDGHEVVDELLALAAVWLRPGGTVVLEIDERRGADALRVAGRVGLVEARIVRDLTGADRAVVAHRAPADASSSSPSNAGSSNPGASSSPGPSLPGA